MDRLKKIIAIAYKLKWIEPSRGDSYPWMQMSEVEKCMLAMVDKSELERLEGWSKDVDEGMVKPISYSEYKRKAIETSNLKTL